ncbi:MAG: gluconokinase, GntK/IdnK-type [Pseudomonadota bacterium]
MTRLIVIMGVAGAGKTTIGKALARRTGWPFIDGDDHHPPANIEKMAASIPLTDEDRTPWIDALLQATNACPAGTPVITACSALTPFVQTRLTATEGRAVAFVHLVLDREATRTRMEQRDHFMKSVLLDSQFAALTPPDGAITLDASQPVDRLVDQVLAALPP